MLAPLGVFDRLRGGYGIGILFSDRSRINLYADSFNILVNFQGMLDLTQFYVHPRYP